MFPLLKSTASQKVYVRLLDSTDHVTPETGITSPTVTVSKNGGALGAVSDGTWAELAGGAYTVQLNDTDTDTVGPLLVRVVKAGCDDAFAICSVRENTEAQVYGRVGAPAGASIAADIAVIDDYVDTEVAAILAAVDTEVASIKAKTDNLPAAPAATGDIPTAVAIRTEMDANSTKLANLDVAVTSRAAAATALSTATWTAEKAGYLDAAVSTRSTLTAQNVWEYATRTLSSYGTLVADVATAVWAAGTRTLTSFGTLVSDIWTAVTRTLTSGAAPSVGDIDAQLSATHGAGAWGGAAGSGSEEMVYTLTLADLTTPIADALVVVTTNSSGTGVVASGRTDAAGEVTFYLDVGTYYLWRFKTGYNFTNPDAETVT